MRGSIAVAAVAILTGATACTTIDRVNVNTVAVDCDVARGDEKQARGQADADLAASAGEGAAEFVGALRSVIVCRDGTKVVAEVDGATSGNGQ